MNRLQLLLNKLAEESTEVAKIALKTAQFGLMERCPGQPLTNAERTHQELDDLMAAVEMLNEEFGFGYEPNQTRIEAKKTKVNKFAAYSQSLGMVTPNVKLRGCALLRSPA
ncbi:hypothetical protein [Sulfuriferula sp.]|uniref:hypothetical protein n=1 Tax=Sulfuriferula sp. TaxID=2025307 RepID=UPI00272F3D44|nr:hypothetical protein [Sulfuriferula sp.]MDP2026247.1 hypothetical protein [Sulfuriferula sp.]